MTLIPLDIPAGFYRNGTELEQSNRWRDGSLVRWRDNSLRPVGGWTERKVGFSSSPVRGMHTWEDLGGTAWVAGGSHDELIAMTGSGLTYDITPSGLAAGRVDAAVETGYGYGFYGLGFYGQPIQQLSTAVPAEATTWNLDNWGEYLVACHYDDGRLLEWDLDTSGIAAPIANAPTNNLGLVVTEERFLFALGAGNNPRKVQWCDQENNTLWTPAATNQAGDIELQTSGQIMQGIQARGQTLVITDLDAHSFTYSGPPFVFNVQKVGSGCGAISRMSAAAVSGNVFWMGQRGFFTYTGNSVQEVDCPVNDKIFGDLNSSQQSKIWAFNNSQFGEIWWFYPSESSTEIDRYVAFDYKENHWLIGSLARTSGISRGVFKQPIMAKSSGDLMDHEIGNNYEGESVYAETGPISIGVGEQTMRVTKLIPDENTQGDVDLTFKTRFYPNEAEVVHGPYNPSNPTSVRFSGRQFRMRVTGDRLTDWKVGIMRVDVKPAGTR